MKLNREKFSYKAAYSLPQNEWEYYYYRNCKIRTKLYDNIPHETPVRIFRVMCVFRKCIRQWLCREIEFFNYEYERRKIEFRKFKSECYRRHFLYIRRDKVLIVFYLDNVIRMSSIMSSILYICIRYYRKQDILTSDLPTSQSSWFHLSL